MTEQVNAMEKIHLQSGLRSYEPGDRLLVHLDYYKTSQMFDKT